MIMTSLKTLTVAAAFATVGFAAQAATVAEITSSGGYSLLSDGSTTGLGVEGSFTAFLDTSFDTTATHDFLFELDLTADGIPPIDEELLVPGITGDDIIGVALGILFELDLAFPGAIGSIIDEVLDGDFAQRELGSTGVWLGFDFDLTDFGVDSVGGTFGGLISEGEFDRSGSVIALADGDYSASATISTVPAVPLPATLPLLTFGGFGLAALKRRRKT